MDTVIMERPKWDKHGYMKPRPALSQSPEQQFCGVWYDCLHCGNSVLLQSPELMKQLNQVSSSD